VRGRLLKSIQQRLQQQFLHKVKQHKPCRGRKVSTTDQSTQGYYVFLARKQRRQQKVIVQGEAKPPTVQKAKPQLASDQIVAQAAPASTALDKPSPDLKHDRKTSSTEARKNSTVQPATSLVNHFAVALRA
jgi:hypothetical protein